MLVIVGKGLSMKLRLIAASILAVSSISAYAQDASSAFDHDGFYVGTTLGYLSQNDKSNTATELDPDADPEDIGWHFSNKPSGAALSILGGYRFHLSPKWLTGVEGSIRFTGADDSSSEVFQGEKDPYSVVKTKVGPFISLRGRLGYLWTPRLQTYATAGLAVTHEKREFKDVIDGENNSDSSWQHGWTAGIGAEYAYNAHLISRVEYRHTDYSKEKVHASYWEESYDQDTTENEFSVGLVYSF